MAEHYVDIIEYGTSDPVEALGPYATERQAEKAERGVGYNLDHRRFYSQIRSEA